MCNRALFYSTSQVRDLVARAAGDRRVHPGVFTRERRPPPPARLPLAARVLQADRQEVSHANWVLSLLRIKVKSLISILSIFEFDDFILSIISVIHSYGANLNK